MVTEPSPRVSRRCVGGVTCVKVVWLVCRVGGWAGCGVGVGWVVMGMRVSSCMESFGSVRIRR